MIRCFALALSLAICGRAACDEVKAKVNAKSNAQTLFDAGAAALNQRNYDEAVVKFKAALQSNPRFVGAYLGLAEVREQTGDMPGAGTFLAKALIIAPDNARVQSAWGQYLFFQKRYAAAEKAYQKAIALDPAGAVPQGQLGDLYLLGLNKPADAVSVYQHSLVLDPLDPHVNLMLGAALLELGRANEAEAQLAKARDLDPRNPAIRKTLAELELKSGRLDAAELDYNKASEFAPGAAWAKIGLGDVAMRRKEYDQAIAAYREASGMDGNSVEAQTKLGMAQKRKGDTPSAEASYKKALDMDPKNGLVANNLAWMLCFDENKPQEALPWAEKAASSDPKNASYQDTLAWVLRANRQPAPALVAGQKAAALQPKDPEILYHLGVLYEESGKANMAVNKYAEALAIADAFSGAADAKARLAALKKN